MQQTEDHVIHLLFSANRWEAAASIHEAVSQGISVVIDRYYYSGIVYSAAKGNPALTLEWAKLPDIGLPRPDLCLFLDITPENAAARGGFGEERYEKREMQMRVRTLFQDLFSRTPEKEDVIVIDASRPLADVEADLWRRVDGLFQSDQLQKPLRSIGAP